MDPQMKSWANVSFEEFLEIDKTSDQRLEYIDGQIFMLSSPSSEHQIVVMNLATEFGVYFRGKGCRPFVSPYDIFLKTEKQEEKNKVQPDLLVVCDEKGIKKNFFEGVPELIVEVLSPSTSMIDYTTKMRKYAKYGVKEYWIVSPQHKFAQVFVLAEDGNYMEPETYSKNEILKSQRFSDFSIDLKSIFTL